MSITGDALEVVMSKIKGKNRLELSTTKENQAAVENFKEDIKNAEKKKKKQVKKKKKQVKKSDQGAKKKKSQRRRLKPKKERNLQVKKMKKKMTKKEKKKTRRRRNPHRVAVRRVTVRVTAHGLNQVTEKRMRNVDNEWLSD